MSDEFINPQKEIQKLTSAIKQYRLILKTTVDPHQQARARKKLKELQSYKERLVATFEIDENALSDSHEDNKFEEDNFITRIKAHSPEKVTYDSEVHELKLYMDFFYTGIKVVLTSI